MLRILAEEGLEREVIGRILAAIREETGLAMTALRLREGNDYPYYTLQGYPAEFVRVETSLFEVGPDGQPLLDASGQPQLSCLCGRFLRGDADPASPCETARGSFHCGRLQALARSPDPLSRSISRGTCVAAGFETLALIPLRHQAEIIGLLHLADHRPDAIAAADLAVLEELAGGIGIALARRRTEEHYHSLFAALGYGFAVHELLVDDAGEPRDYVTLEVNPAFERLLGATADQVIGRRVSEVLPPEELARWLPLFGGVVRSGEPVHYEQHSPHNDRTFRGYAYRPEPGRFAVLFEDVTEQHRLAAALRQSELQVRQTQKLEAIGQLAGGIAHDFNNLLATMTIQIGLLQLQADTLSAPEVLSVTEDLLATTRKAAGLTQQLLLYSRRRALTMARQDLARLVERHVGILIRVVGEPYGIDVAAAPEPLWFEGDGGLIEQVITNLCLNARDAMPGGGRIQISIAALDVTPELARAWRGADPGDFVRIRIADTGTGMDEATLGHLFEPFFSTKELGKGTGLGLATSLGIVTEHRGFITVDSTAGRGTSVDVYLPRCEVDADRETAAPGAPASGAGQRILIVEDDRSVRQLAASALVRLGYAVCQADTAAAALAIWELGPADFDLVITDQVMPGGVSGQELLEQLRRQRPSLRAIISSGYSVERFPLGAAEAQLTRLLGKPYDLQTLAATVREALQVTEASSEDEEGRFRSGR
jgi:PAS domain S-box-containing protein